MTILTCKEFYLQRKLLTTVFNIPDDQSLVVWWWHKHTSCNHNKMRDSSITEWYRQTWEASYLPQELETYHLHWSCKHWQSLHVLLKRWLVLVSCKQENSYWKNIKTIMVYCQHLQKVAFIWLDTKSTKTMEWRSTNYWYLTFNFFQQQQKNQCITFWSIHVIVYHWQSLSGACSLSQHFAFAIWCSFLAFTEWFWYWRQPDVAYL